jgi:hypothetical protein
MNLVYIIPDGNESRKPFLIARNPDPNARRLHGYKRDV